MLTSHVRTPQLALIFSILAPLSAALLTGCGDNLKVPTPATVDTHASTIELTPADGAPADGVSWVIARVTVKDAGGQPLNGMAVQIDASGEGNLVEQPPMRTGVDGVALGSIAATIAGTKELTVTVSNGVASFELEQHPAVVLTPVAQRLAFLVPPTDVVAGEAFAPALRVAILDNVGTTMTDVTGPVTLAFGVDPVNGPANGVLRGTLTVDAVAGVATFDDVVIDTAAAGYTLVASAPGLASAESDPFTVEPAAPATLAFVEQPGDVVAGVSLDPPVAVAALDALGNIATNLDGFVTVALDENPGAGTLAGTLTRSLQQGIAHFHDLAVDKAGAGYTLVATSGSLPAATSDAFDVTAASVAQLELVGLPDPDVAGTTAGLVVTARDQFGNVIADFADTVAFTSTDGQAVLPATYAFQAADHGAHTFAGVALRTAGTQSITATSQADATITGTLTRLVTPAPATALEFTTQPSASRSGVPVSPAVVVTLRDPYGNAAADTATQVSLAIATGPTGASLVGGGPRPPVTGLVAFDHVTLDKAGTYTLVATAGSLTPATSGSFAIAAGDPAALAFVVEPSDATSGAAVAPAVKVGLFDAAGNPAAVATNAVTLTVASGPGGATVTGLGPVAAVGGVATFAAVTADLVGTYTLAAAATGLTGATSTAFDVAPGAATKLAFSVGPTDAVAGTALSPAVVVVVQDANGNPVPTATPDVTLAIVTGPTGATIQGAGPVTAAAGVATFPGVKLQLAGDYTLRALATGGLQSGASGTFTVGAAAAAKLAFGVEPTNSSPGGTISPAVTVGLQDTFGNPVSASTPSVSLGLSGGTGGAVLTGGGATAPVGGVATFAGVSVDAAGLGYTLVASASGLASATSSAFAIFGPAHHVAFVTQPPSRPVNGAFGVTVAVQDASNITRTTDNGSVIALAIGTNPGSGTLAGTTTGTVSGGVATFTGLSIGSAGTGYTLQATSGALVPATSNLFTIFGPATKLLFAANPPPSVALGADFTVKVAVADAGGNTVMNDNTTAITVALHAGAPVGATLGGTKTVTAAAGVASFAALALDVSAPGYQLDATGGGYTPATSSAFDVYTTPGAGELMITEIMHATGGDQLQQWFEVRNLTDKVFAVAGLTFQEPISSSPQFTTTGGTLIQPRAYFVFGGSADPALNGGVTTVGYVYPDTFALGAAGSGHLIISSSGGPVDEVLWDTTFPQTADTAMNLSADAQKGDASQYSWWWCDATGSLTGGGKGSPGLPNVVCGTAASDPIDLCALYNPIDIASPVIATAPIPIQGRFSEAGVTDRATCNDFYPFVDGQVGVGVPSSDPTTAWTWFDAAFDPSYTSSCVAGQDQMIGNAVFPREGAFVFGYRFRLVDPDTGTAGNWTYCDRNGIAASPAAGVYGTATATPTVVISQVYGGGGNSGAPYQSDFIELHNRGTTAASLAGWSVQYGSATGTTWTDRTNLSGTIPPGGYFLIQEATGNSCSGAPCGIPLPTPDLTAASPIAMGGTGGKVALVASTTPLVGACPLGGAVRILDFVGYNSTGANACSEGTTTGAVTNATGVIRKDTTGATASCTDTNNNGSDFVVATPAPRNSASTANTCF